MPIPEAHTIPSKDRLYAAKLAEKAQRSTLNGDKVSPNPVLAPYHSQGSGYPNCTVTTSPQSRQLPAALMKVTWCASDIMIVRMQPPKAQATPAREERKLRGRTLNARPPSRDQNILDIDLMPSDRTDCFVEGTLLPGSIRSWWRVCSLICASPRGNWLSWTGWFLELPGFVLAGWVGFEPTICGSAGRRLGPGSTTSPENRPTE